MKFVAIFLVTVLLPASNLLLAAESADISALRALDQSYATKWIEGDADGVMALFTEDATLVPHHGDDPIRNRSTSSKNLLQHCYLESCHCAVRSSPFSTLNPPPQIVTP